MGQRLVVNIMKDGEAIANAYYHWSAYTSSAAAITNEICEIYEDTKRLARSDLELAVELLQATGAGLNEEEWNRIHTMDSNLINEIELHNCIDRNHGLLAITAKGIEDNESWSEGSVYIDIATEEVNFAVACYYYIEEFKREYADELMPGGWLYEIETVEEDPFEDVEISTFHEVVKFIEDHPRGAICGGDVYLWVE